MRDNLYVWDREVVRQGSPCPCGEDREVANVTHHKLTGNKIVETVCRECKQPKQMVETYRRN